MPNRLAQETSPYLRQHQDNPIDWLPWGDEAFRRAKDEDKPVFLSVGYSSCHWCHVMAHESFEDVEVASLLNRNFVSIKVDREERPDVDEAYMAAVQLQSGRGGWPMSVFLTPERDPFFAGTYFPKLDRGGHPGFLRILQELDAMWRNRKPQVLEAALEFRKALQETLGRPAPKTWQSLSMDFLKEAFASLAADFDSVHGGFGGAPKFPPHSAIEFCLAIADAEGFDEGMREQARTIADNTLETMCLGGIHDHIGGGFHRYSTDAKWLLPHFEKMLYDNALMLRNLRRAPASPLFVEAADGIEAWLRREMISDDGLLCSALDADSEGEEGKFYVWTVAEVEEVLGDRANDFLAAYSFEVEGNFLDEATHRKTGANIPHLSETLSEDFSSELKALAQRRESRERPMRDDKALAGWNGLALAARPSFGPHLIKALGRFWNAGQALPHQIAYGRASGRAYLEDVAALAFGFAETGENNEALLELLEDFEDTASGGYYAVTESHEELFGRAKPYFDQPIPSGNALAARALLKAGRIGKAREVVESGLGWAERAPGATEALLLAGLEILIREGAAQTGGKVEPARSEPVAFRILPETWRRTSDNWVQGQVEIAIALGYHINAVEPELRWLVPTRIVSEAGHVHVEFPPDDQGQFEGTIRANVKIETRLDGFELTLKAQACTDTECLAPCEITRSVVF